MAFAPTALAGQETQNLPDHKLGIYTKTTFPDATKNKGRIIMLTNGGASDAPCLAVSDGVGWFVVAVGAVVA